MTEQQFTQRIEGLVNDFQNADSTRKELFDGIMETCINLAKPLQRTIEEQSNLLKRQIEQNEQLTAKHEKLVKISEDILNAMAKDDVDDMFEAEKELRKLLTESEDGK